MGVTVAVGQLCPPDRPCSSIHLHILLVHALVPTCTCWIATKRAVDSLPTCGLCGSMFLLIPEWKKGPAGRNSSFCEVTLFQGCEGGREREDDRAGHETGAKRMARSVARQAETSSSWCDVTLAYRWSCELLIINTWQWFTRLGLHNCGSLHRSSMCVHLWLNLGHRGGQSG